MAARGGVVFWPQFMVKRPENVQEAIMPQLIALAIAGAGVYAGARWMARKVATVMAEMERQQAEVRRRAAEASGQPRDLGTLELDPKSGVYKPRTHG